MNKKVIEGDVGDTCGFLTISAAKVRITYRVVAISLCLLAGSASAEETYRISVKRLSQDLYQVIGQDIVIKTRYCYQYTFGEDAILIIESPHGFNVGRIIFLDSTTECAVEKILG